MNFANEDIRIAAAERYLKEDKGREEHHRYIGVKRVRKCGLWRAGAGRGSMLITHHTASFFHDKPEFDERKAEELPWQLAKCKDWKELHRVLSDLR